MNERQQNFAREARILSKPITACAHQLFMKSSSWQVAGYYLDHAQHKFNVMGTFSVNHGPHNNPSHDNPSLNNLPADGYRHKHHLGNCNTPFVTESCIFLSDSFSKNPSDINLASYSNKRVIEPFSPLKNTTVWHSSHPLTGTIHGSLTIVEDSLLSSFHSTNHYYAGSEHLIRVFDDEYSSWGAVLAAGQRLWSWRLELTRES